MELMAPSKPKLSICIPTYNRARFLEPLLQDIFSDPPDCSFELIVCDNNSTDGTSLLLSEWASRYSQMRIFRQTANLGGYANTMTAFRMARGDYCTYLADDSRLIIPGINDAMLYLNRYPDLVCYYAPQELYDGFDDRSIGIAYNIAGDITFSKNDAIGLLNFILQPGIWPEIGIYKSKAIQRRLAGPSRANWFLVNMADMLEYGDLSFRNAPFYRHYVRHAIGRPPGRSAGEQDLVNKRDVHEAGLQYIAAKAYQYVGVEDIPAGQLAILSEMIGKCTDAALIGGTELLIEWGEVRDVYEFLLRQKARGCLSEDQVQRFRSGSTERAVAQTVVGILDNMSVTDRFAIFHVNNRQEMISKINEYSPGLKVEVLDDMDIDLIEDKIRMFVLAGSEEDRDLLIMAGFEPGLIVLENDLSSKYRI